MQKPQAASSACRLLQVFFHLLKILTTTLYTHLRVSTHALVNTMLAQIVNAHTNQSQQKPQPQRIQLTRSTAYSVILLQFAIREPLGLTP